MLGMMDKGGGSQMMPQGQNPNLAALFRGNIAAGPQAQTQQIPQIMPPARPAVMPPAARLPMQQTMAPKPMDPNNMIATGDGRLKPAWMTSLIQQTGRPTAQQTNKSAYTTFRNR